MQTVEWDGHVDNKGIRYIGRAARQGDGSYIGLAVVGGALCRVQATIALPAFDPLLCDVPNCRVCNRSVEAP